MLGHRQLLEQQMRIENIEDNKGKLNKELGSLLLNNRLKEINNRCNKELFSKLQLAKQLHTQ